MKKNAIDFVILWVDGKDEKWLEEKRKYTAGKHDDDRVQRYRYWDNLQFWFRGVEKYAPWVNKIFFITWGHVPKWLDTSNPKLRIIKHSDYIPDDYLPVFNSNVIELLLNRIEDLSEYFVLFNDDIFLLKNVRESDFFKKELPCDSVGLNVHSVVLGKTDNFSSLLAMSIVNKYFNMKQSITANWWKWLSPKNGEMVLRTLYLLPCPVFPEIRQIHLPCSYLKSTFDTVWAKENDLLQETCTHRFRTRLDFSHWTMRNWQIASGQFTTRSNHFGKSFEISTDKDLELCIKYIAKKKGAVVCINDGNTDDCTFQRYKDSINNELKRILPDKCMFEL